MARLKNNSLQGPFTGKIGDIVGCRWKDTYYIRSRPKKVNHPNTEKQLAQRMRFVKTQSYLQPLKEFLRIGFSAFTATRSAYNAAMSYNMKNALIGEYPEISVVPSAILVSRGNLPGNVKAAAKPVSGNTVKFFWNTSEAIPLERENDKVLLVLRSLNDKLSDYRIDAGKRIDGEAHIKTDAAFMGKDIACYLVFVKQKVLLGSYDEDAISDSIYCGRIHMNGG